MSSKDGLNQNYTLSLHQKQHLLENVERIATHEDHRQSHLYPRNNQNIRGLRSRQVGLRTVQRVTSDRLTEKATKGKQMFPVDLCLITTNRY